MIIGVNYFMLRALTLSGEWHSFTIRDLPTLYTKEEFVTLGINGSPRLKVHPILRGDFESGLYEGDVIQMDGEKWLVCYERGFYAISQSYVVRYLYTLHDYVLLGTCYEIDCGIVSSFREKHIFKYNGNHFRLNDIYGCHDNKLIVRDIQTPINPEDVQQEACMTYQKRRVFLGDDVDIGRVKCKGGRLTVEYNGEIIDITTGGVLSDYNSGSARRS